MGVGRRTENNRSCYPLVAFTTDAEGGNDMKTLLFFLIYFAMVFAICAFVAAATYKNPEDDDQ